MTTKTKPETTPTPPSDLSAWDMARSILSGLEQARDRALEEYDAAHAVDPRNPYTASKGQTRDILELLQRARRDLEDDMNSAARMNGLEL
ncbi:MAG: hypothetical protein AAGA28_05050 [Pseudomonadota bacterium]